MAVWGLKPRGDLLTTVAIGVGVLAAPVVVPLAWSVTRPLLKAVLKGGFRAYELGRETFGFGTEEREQQSTAKPSLTSERKIESQESVTAKEQTASVVKDDGKTEEMKSHSKASDEKPKRQKKPTRKKAEKEK